MVTEIQYTNIRRVLDDLTDHPLLRDITLEQVVRHTIRFIALHGYPKLYEDKEAIIGIKGFRGLLPCDLISIIQVKDCMSGLCMRAMTDTFGRVEDSETRGTSNPRDSRFSREFIGEPAFKTQGRIIFTSFPEGEVKIAYKSIPVDEDGYPLLIDNEVYLNALEAYIKVKVFTVKFDTGDISAGVLSNAQTEYAWASHGLQSEMTIPSVSEMEAISRYLTTTIKSVKQFDKGFRELGDREYIRRH